MSMRRQGFEWEVADLGNLPPKKDWRIWKLLNQYSILNLELLLLRIVKER